MSDPTQTAVLGTASLFPNDIENGDAAHDLPRELMAGAAEHPMASEVLHEERYHAARDRVLQQFEKQYLLHLMNRTRGNLTEAARIAAVNRTTLYRMMERNGLQRAPSLAWLMEVEGNHPPGRG